MNERKKNKKHDAIAMKRCIQEEVYEETKDLSPEGYIVYVRQQIVNSCFADFLSQSRPSSIATSADQTPQPPAV